MQPSLYDDPDLADWLREATAGRPDLLCMAIGIIAEHGVPDGPLAAALARAGGPIMTSVCHSLPSDLLGVPVNAGEHLTVTPDLCEILGHPNGEEAMRRLRQAGVLAGNRVIPVVVHAARALRDPDPEALAAAGRRLEEQGRAVEAVRAFAEAGPARWCGCSTATGNVVLQARILTNQTYQLLHEGRYERALHAATTSRTGSAPIGSRHTGSSGARRRRRR